MASKYLEHPPLTQRERRMLKALVRLQKEYGGGEDTAYQAMLWGDVREVIAEAQKADQ